MIAQCDKHNLVREILLLVEDFIDCIRCSTAYISHSAPRSYVEPHNYHGVEVEVTLEYDGDELHLRMTKPDNTILSYYFWFNKLNGGLQMDYEDWRTGHNNILDYNVEELEVILGVLKTMRNRLEKEFPEYW